MLYFNLYLDVYQLQSWGIYCTCIAFEGMVITQKRGILKKFVAENHTETVGTFKITLKNNIKGFTENYTEMMPLLFRNANYRAVIEIFFSCRHIGYKILTCWRHVNIYDLKFCTNIVSCSIALSYSKPTMPTSGWGDWNDRFINIHSTKKELSYTTNPEVQRTLQL